MFTSYRINMLVYILGAHVVYKEWILDVVKIKLCECTYIIMNICWIILNLKQYITVQKRIVRLSDFLYEECGSFIYTIHNTSGRSLRIDIV